MLIAEVQFCSDEPLHIEMVTPLVKDTCVCCSPIDLDQLVVHSLQHRPVLHRCSVLQRFVPDLLLPF